MSIEEAVDVFCAVSKSTLLSCVPRNNRKLIVSKCSRSNGAYCGTALAVVSQYHAVEPSYLWYYNTKMYRELHGIGT